MALVGIILVLVPAYAISPILAFILVGVFVLSCRIHQGIRKG
jgi:hypothetical protein